MSAEDNKNKILTGLKAVKAHDVDGFTRLLEPGFKLYVITKPEQLFPQGSLNGREGFGTYLNMLYTAFADVDFQQLNIEAQGNMVHQEFRITGKHTGPLVLPNGVKVSPTGIKINLQVEVFHTFNAEGGFISSTGYANLLDIMKMFTGRS
jgi:predicted ester cyclase